MIAADSFGVLNENKENSKILYTRKNDNLLNIIEELGFQPWHMFIAFAIVFFISVLICWICSGLIKCFNNKYKHDNESCLLQGENSNDNIHSNPTIPDNFIISEPVTRVYFLKCYSDLQI